MDLAFTEDQLELRDLARRILTTHVTTDRLKEIEGEPDRIDRQLWSELARAGFLELDDVVDICLLLEEQGRTVAPVPLWPTLVARRMLGDRAFAPDSILTVALPADGEEDSAFVPAADVATAAVAPRRDGGLVLVDPASVELERSIATTGEPVGRVSLEDSKGN